MREVILKEQRMSEEVFILYEKYQTQTKHKSKKNWKDMKQKGLRTKSLF